MRNFLQKNLRPWSVPWIFQRFFTVLKEGRLPQISMRDLLYDLRLTRKINSSYRGARNAIENKVEYTEDGIFNLLPSMEYHPFIVNEHLLPEDLSMVNSYFDHVYVVNLGRRIDRRLEMVQKLTRYRIKAEIFEAEDGLTKDNQQEFYKYYEEPIAGKNSHPLERALRKKMIISPGSWAYLKTYKKLLLDAKSKGYRNILCFDDDVLFHLSFEESLKKSLLNIPSGWKLLYLGATQHEWKVPACLDFPGHTMPEDLYSVPYYFPLRTDGSFAAGIDASVYDDILKEIEPMNCSLDSGPLRTIQQNYPGQCFVLLPNLVVAEVSQSDIGVERDQEHMAHKLRWKMGLYDYPFHKELVSVIMPAYNAGKTIEKSIRSILLQTYRELEMIVADDGSTDDTPEIVQRLAREDHRVKLVRLESNRGCYAARNAALRASSGNYIAIQDSDDISLSTRIESQLIPLLLGRAEFTLTRIFRSRCTVDELDISNQREMIRLVLSRRVSSPAGFHEYRDRPVIGFMTSMFTRKLFEDLGLFWESRFGADAEFIERSLYQRAGIILTKKDRTIHSWLTEKENIPGLYERIDKVQLISFDMNHDNITNRYSRHEKKEFESTWRKKLRGEFVYAYPTFGQKSDQTDK